MKYQALPVIVDAFEIVEVQSDSDGRTCRVMTDGGGAALTANKEMLARYWPKAGDYWVIQSDGYEYLNPKSVFEGKYVRADQAKAKVEAKIERAVTDERHRCMDILTAARNGEIDADLRSLIRRIEFGDRV